METQLIAAADFCASHKIELSFIDSLQTYGLVEITIIEENPFIPAVQIGKLEQLVHLHFELDINLEGIDAILRLLERVKNMQNEIISLKNRLRLYEITEYKQDDNDLPDTGI